MLFGLRSGFLDGGEGGYSSQPTRTQPSSTAM